MNDEVDFGTGRKLVIAVIVIVLGMSVLVSGLYIAILGPQNIIVQIVRFCFEITLCCYLYQGRNWARWVICALFGVAGSAALISGVTKPSSLMMLMGIAYLFCASVLSLSSAVRAFLRAQRAKKLEGSAGTK